IVDALRDLLSRSDSVLICGGLGPTQDDLTRDAIAELMGVPLVRHMDLAEHIATMFRSRLRDMPQNNLRQADVPDGGHALANPLGTAPGLRCRSEEHTSELQSRFDLVCRLLLEKKKKKMNQ